VKDVQTLAVADIDSDHSLLVTKVCTRLKVPNEKSTMGFGEIIYSKTKSARILEKRNSVQWM